MYKTIIKFVLRWISAVVESQDVTLKVPMPCKVGVLSLSLFKIFKGYFAPHCVCQQKNLFLLKADKLLCSIDFVYGATLLQVNEESCWIPAVRDRILVIFVTLVNLIAWSLFLKESREHDGFARG